MNDPAICESAEEVLSTLATLEASDYCLLADATPVELSAKVGAALKDGWSLWGDPVCMPPSEYGPQTFCQALVRYCDPDATETQTETEPATLAS